MRRSAGTGKHAMSLALGRFATLITQPSDQRAPTSMKGAGRVEGGDLCVIRDPVDVGSLGQKVLGHPALAAGACLPEGIVDVLGCRRRMNCQKFFHARRHPQGCRVPKTLNSSPSLDQKARNAPAPVAYRIVQRGTSGNRGACRFDVGATGDERGGHVNIVAARCPVQRGLRARAARHRGIRVGTPADEKIDDCRTTRKVPRPISGDVQRGTRRSLVALEPHRRQLRMFVKETLERVNVTSADRLDQRYGEDIVTGQSWHIFTMARVGYVGLSRQLTTIGTAH